MSLIRMICLVLLLSIAALQACARRLPEQEAHVQRLLLTSNGLTTPELRREFSRLLRKNNRAEPAVLYIPDAAIGEGGQEAVLCAQRSAELIGLGAHTVECLPLKSAQPSEIRAKLDTCDAVYVDYGNTFYLTYYMRSSGFAGLIHSAVKQGILYVGSSASTIAAGPTASIAFWKGWDDPGYESRIRYGMKLELQVLCILYTRNLPANLYDSGIEKV
ncbi:hypothetical protein CYMTET_35356 [Cymbomonas tetramitiformis]|uniref:Uncharacterized protein n=1 Tax=Cymbomonas tetramitiformis TaxID=36881 RepID=A0AAE0F9F6_9CHLO|nr:hypothetical protein CYMTET_35356 [Cymbomonas tetramitiformis]